MDNYRKINYRFLNYLTNTKDINFKFLVLVNESH